MKIEGGGGQHNPSGLWAVLLSTQQSEVASVPALAWLLTKAVLYVAPRVAFPALETETEGDKIK